MRLKHVMIGVLAYLGGAALMLVLTLIITGGGGLLSIMSAADRTKSPVIIQASRGGLELIAAGGAPSASAVEAAHRLGITLCGLVRAGRRWWQLQRMHREVFGAVLAAGDRPVVAVFEAETEMIAQAKGLLSYLPANNLILYIPCFHCQRMSILNVNI